MDLKRREFLDLQQGRMDLRTYGCEFNHLSRYAPRDVTTDADKQELFRKGLSPQLRYELLPFKFHTYQELFNQAFTLEQGRKELEASKRPHMGTIRVPRVLRARSARCLFPTALYRVLHLCRGPRDTGHHLHAPLLRHLG